VPTIVWQPGKVPASTVCDELVTTMDLLPTFVKLAGGALPSERKIDGHDIAPLLFGDADAKTPYKSFYYYHQEQLQAVRSGPWKLFLPVVTTRAHPHFNKERKAEYLLFNLEDDTASEKNVAVEHPNIVARLRRIADEARAELGDQGVRGKGQRSPGKVADPVPQLLR